MQPALTGTMESLNEALRECVTALGGPKRVGPAMRPEMSVDQASQYVRDRLNPDRRERFDPDQVVWLLREARGVGFHGGMQFVNGACGYAAPLPVDPADEAAELQRAFIESVKQQQRMLGRLGELGAVPLKAVG